MCLQDIITSSAVSEEDSEQTFGISGLSVQTIQQNAISGPNSCCVQHKHPHTIREGAEEMHSITGGSAFIRMSSLIALQSHSAVNNQLTCVPLLLAQFPATVGSMCSTQTCFCLLTVLS